MAAEVTGVHHSASNVVYIDSVSSWLHKHGKAVRPQLDRRQLDALRECFDIIDTDGTGTITVEELCSVFTALGDHVSLEAVARVLDTIRHHGSDGIRFTDFIAIMTRDSEDLQYGQRRGKADVTTAYNIAIMARAYRRKKVLEAVFKDEGGWRAKFVYMHDRLKDRERDHQHRLVAESMMPQPSLVSSLQHAQSMSEHIDAAHEQPQPSPHTQVAFSETGVSIAAGTGIQAPANTVRFGTGALSIVTAAIVGDLPDTEDGQVWGVAQQRQITPESSEEPMLPRHARTTDKLALTMKAQHKLQELQNTAESVLTPRWQADVSGGHHLHEIFSSSLQFQAAHDADCNSVADFFKDAAAAASDSAEHPKSALLIAAPAAAPVSATHDASGSISNEIATSPGDFTFAVPVVDQSAYMYQGNGAGMALGSSLDAGDNTGRDKHAEGTAYQQSIKQRACVSKSNRTDCTDGTTHLAVDTDAGHVLRPHNRGLAEADTKVVVNVGLQHNAQANIAVELVQPPSSPEVCSLDVLIKTGHVGGTPLSHLQYASPRNKQRQAAFLGQPSSSPRTAWNTSTRAQSAHHPLTSPVQAWQQQRQQQPPYSTVAEVNNTCPGSSTNVHTLRPHTQPQPLQYVGTSLDCKIADGAAAQSEESSNAASAADLLDLDAAATVKKAVMCRARNAARPAVPALELAAIRTRALHRPQTTAGQRSSARTHPMLSHTGSLEKHRQARPATVSSRQTVGASQLADQAGRPPPAGGADRLKTAGATSRPRSSVWDSTTAAIGFSFDNAEDRPVVLRAARAPLTAPAQSPRAPWLQKAALTAAKFRQASRAQTARPADCTKTITQDGLCGTTRSAAWHSSMSKRLAMQDRAVNRPTALGQQLKLDTQAQVRMLAEQQTARGL